MILFGLGRWLIYAGFFCFHCFSGLGSFIKRLCKGFFFKLKQGYPMACKDSIVKYVFPHSQSSLCSIKIALIRRRQDSSLGKILTTLVRRRISRLSRSKALFVLSRLRCFGGNENTVNPSGKSYSNQFANCGALYSYLTINRFK